MSAARRQRRQAQLAARRADKRYRRDVAKPITGILDGAGEFGPVVTGDPASYERVIRGDATFVVMKVPDDAPHPIKAAIARRRQAVLDGRCDCGGTFGRTQPNTGAGVGHANLVHRIDCDASDEALLALAQLHDWRPS